MVGHVDDGTLTLWIEPIDIRATLRAERNQILATLADVLRYVEPCGHEPPDPQCCTDCHARALLARYASPEVDHA